MIPTATNPDGTYAESFLIWEAEMGFRVAARTVVHTARILRSTLGAYDVATMNPTIIGLAVIRAPREPAVARCLDAYRAANQAFMDAAWARAEVDAAFDIRPFLAASR